MSKHTKGPWKLRGLSESGHPHFCVIGTKLGGKYKIARAPFVITDYDEITKRNEAEAKANAQLIAAAPEMYELLDRLIDAGQDLEKIAAIKAEVYVVFSNIYAE